MKKLLLLFVGLLFYCVAHAAVHDTLVVQKPNGENIISIRRATTHGAFVVSVGGFDMTLGGSASDYRGGYDPLCDTTRWERQVISNDLTPGRETLIYAWFPRRERDNTIWVSHRNYAYDGAPWRYDSTVITMRNDTLYHYSSTHAAAGLCLCGCGRPGCRCGKSATQIVRTNTTVKNKMHTTTHVTFGESHLKISERDDRESTMHLNFGFLGFDGDAEWMKLRHSRSISLGIDMRYNIALDRSRNVWFSMGIRPRWDNYVFHDNITLGRSGGQIVAVPLQTDGRFKKSKLGVFSLDVPVAFEFCMWRAITLETGIYGGLALGDRTKVKFPKVKDKSDWDTNFWQAGATVRLKIKPVPFGVFGSYSFVPLFEHGAGPRIQPFTIGIYL